MRRSKLSYWVNRSAIALTLMAAAVAPSNSRAITLGQIDDFNNTTSTLNWGIGTDGSTPVANAPDVGATMTAGDNALLVDTNALSVSRLLVINTMQWTGNWTSAGVEQISLDVRNPNNFPLSMRLGIAKGSVGSMGSGDTYVTNAIVVPADNAWHSIVFDVLASNFNALGGTDIAAALANVNHFRIINNSNPSFLGSTMGGAMYLDNIRAQAVAVPEPGTLALGAMGFSIFALWRWNDRSAAKRK